MTYVVSALIFFGSMKISSNFIMQRDLRFPGLRFAFQLAEMRRLNVWNMRSQVRHFECCRIERSSSVEYIAVSEGYLNCNVITE